LWAFFASSIGGVSSLTSADDTLLGFARACCAGRGQLATPPALTGNQLVTCDDAWAGEQRSAPAQGTKANDPTQVCGSSADGHHSPTTLSSTRPGSKTIPAPPDLTDGE
jgi:hypothetical protein